MNFSDFREFLRELTGRHAVKPPPRVPVPGEFWYFKNANGDPWPPIDYDPVEILDTKDGWVRYFMNDRFPDLRRTLKDFMSMYAPRSPE